MGNYGYHIVGKKINHVGIEVNHHKENDILLDDKKNDYLWQGG